jgi:hypothetical protein
MRDNLLSRRNNEPPINRSTLDSRRRIKHDAQFWSLRAGNWRYLASATPLVIDKSGLVTIGGDAEKYVVLTLARLAGEWLHLVRRGAPTILAGWAAARVAAQFARAEHFPPDDQTAWIAAMAADRAPSIDLLKTMAATLRKYWSGMTAEFSGDDAARIVVLWPAIGTCETIMEMGGDIRLLRDPQTDLNGYGCSHRPRPWAVTFASSTASSISERGYEAADRARIRLTANMLKSGDQSAIRTEASAVRRAIGRAIGMPPGGGIALAASGTDSELLALALCHLPAADHPITTILLAPEETGSGVPMAAMGRHFAVDTANGHDVSRSSPIIGFRADTALVPIALRDQTGEVRNSDTVEAEITEAVMFAVAAGRRVILHALDLSKTGLLAPSMDLLRALRKKFPDKLDIVVDACQLRIGPERIHAYLAIDALVQITGSKFLTGPPFAGAALMSPAIAARLKSGYLPAGLDAYFSQGEWPQGATAAHNLPDGANFGLLLRWRAALAEYRAFAAVSDVHKRSIIQRFEATVLQAIERHPFLVLQQVPSLQRDSPLWDEQRTVFAFAIRNPEDANSLLDPKPMRRLYRWLNADCGGLFEGARDRQIASRICHIGQPVALPNKQGSQTGWLRVSAGARLISGEPSHRGLAIERRTTREMDDLTAVFDKIALLHANWNCIEAADPVARYR